MADTHQERNPDDVGIEELLQQVGVRDEPSAQVADEVHRAVRAEWLAMVAERSRRRRVVGYAAAAGIVVSVLAGTIVLKTLLPQPVSVAQVVRVDGRLEARSADARRTVDAGQQVASGEVLRTDAQTRVALDFGAGLSVRLDSNTHVDLIARDRLALRSGAVYVDAQTASGAEAAPLVIDTAAGSIRHLGTQYQVRSNGHVEISIREGRVEIANPGGKSLAGAGERLEIARNGDITRSIVAAQDPSWGWAMQVAPLFEIDDQPLSAFLAWVARETGRELVYDSQQTRTLAANVKLRGSIAGLDPDTALTAVLSTTQLRSVETNDGKLSIALAGGD